MLKNPSIKKQKQFTFLLFYAIFEITKTKGFAMKKLIRINKLYPLFVIASIFLVVLFGMLFVWQITKDQRLPVFVSSQFTLYDIDEDEYELDEDKYAIRIVGELFNRDKLDYYNSVIEVRVSTKTGGLKRDFKVTPVQLMSDSFYKFDQVYITNIEYDHVDKVLVRIYGNQIELSNPSAYIRINGVSILILAGFGLSLAGMVYAIRKNIAHQKQIKEIAKIEMVKILAAKTAVKPITISDAALVNAKESTKLSYETKTAPAKPKKSPPCEYCGMRSDADADLCQYCGARLKK